MSDTSKGPEWWLASDGKWYPPSSRPGPAQPPSSRRGGSSEWERRPWVSPSLAAWVQGLLWAAGAMYLLTAALTVNAYRVFEEYGDGEASLTTWSLAHDSYTVGFGLALLLWIAGYIVFVVWSNKAHKATDALDPGRRTWSSGWTVGGWFIPVALLVIPKLVLNEIEKIAKAPRQDGLVTADWRQEQTSVIGWAWWLLFVAGSLAFFISSTAWDQTDLTVPAADIRLGYQAQLAASLLWAGSGACGALFVRRLSRHLSPQSFEAEVIYY